MPVPVEQRGVHDDLSPVLLAGHGEGLAGGDPQLDLVGDRQKSGLPGHRTAILRTEQGSVGPDIHLLVACLADHRRQQGQLAVREPGEVRFGEDVRGVFVPAVVVDAPPDVQDGCRL